MKTFPRASLSVSLSAIAFVALASAVLPAIAQRRVVSPVDESLRVTLAGNTRPEANAKNDLGEVEGSLPLEHLQLLLRRSDRLQSDLDAYTESLSDKRSPNYHHWLTAAQFGARFGVAQEDIDAVTDWLNGRGFVVNFVSPNRLTIDFTGTASQVREAFSTEIHAYEVRGVRHIANSRDPQVPAALAPVITGIVSLHDFRPRPMLKPRTNYTFTDNNVDWYAVTPPDLATIYNLRKLFNAGFTGKGQTVVVVEDTNLFSSNDWVNFRKKFGLSAYTSGVLKTVHPAPASGGTNCHNPGVNPNGDDGEAILDAEWASAAAPNATIEVASCDNTATLFGGQIALQNLLDASKTPPAIVSISYGECEAEMGATANMQFKNLYQQAVNEGVSVFVSSGDENAASCDAGNAKASHGISVSGMASSAFNVAVGGTDFADSYLKDNATYWNSANSSTFGSAKSYIPEIPWNDSCASTLLAKFFNNGSATTYGTKGFCNTTTGIDNFLGVTGGSGGPSACASGVPAVSDVVGGTCHGWAKPSWQSLVGVPADHVRDIPDVSLFAANGVWGHYFVYCYTNIGNGGAPCTGAPSGWSGAGGTSFSAPIMAAIQALVNQKWGRQGNPNPVYYTIAKAEYGTSGNAACNSSKGNAVGASCVFYDVTMGDMDTNCIGTHNCYRPSGTNGVLSTSNTAYSPAYKTKTGWDFATGIGTVNAYNLVFSNKW